MYLEVPVKLESYVSAIKQQTQYLNTDCDCITLLQVGKANKDEHTKLMYLIYNPYPINLHVDLNLFNDINNLYKMYPGEFSVSPNTCYAFVVYVNSDSILSINERSLINHLKRNVDHKLINLLDYDFSGKYKNSLIYSIEDPQHEIDQTVVLPSTNRVMQPEVQEFINFSSQYLDEMQMELDNLSMQDDCYKFCFKFTNHNEHNFIVSRIRLKLFNDQKKFYVNIKEQVKFKAYSSKVVSVFIPTNELHDVDVTTLEIKISLT